MTTITALKYATLGTVSHGTLRTEDLLESFLSEIQWQLSRNGHYFSQPENFIERDRLSNLAGRAQDCYDEAGDGIDPDQEEEAEYLLNELLPDALQTFAPPYCYFGSHPGDGADFGFWPSFESIDELPTVGDSSAARELGEDCKSVNDHGNVTIYNGLGEVILAIV